jgi:hypothetical protein
VAIKSEDLGSGARIETMITDFLLPADQWLRTSMHIQGVLSSDGILARQPRDQILHHGQAAVVESLSWAEGANLVKVLGMSW